VAEDAPETWDTKRLRDELERARGEMFKAADELRFEEAAQLRDRVHRLETIELER
jgi:excinuclease UvrABC helicase subunit UvrB